MRKKWIYIFTLCCLVNSLFSFYTGAAVHSTNGQPLVADVDSRASSTSLLDMLISQFQDDDDDQGKAPFKSFHRHTLSIIRGLAINIQAPRQILQTLFDAFRIPGITRHVYGNHLIRKPILPSYYNFLFRLSPF